MNEPETKMMRLKILICLLLAGGTLAIYWPAAHFDIVNYDDSFFVNIPETANGLTWHSLEWAMTSVVVSNWHPVTVLSFVLTRQFFGVNSGAEHLVNAGFHAANAALLFLVLLRICSASALQTSAPVWRCAMVAAIFAWHPLRVESVAWIAERKDVLFVFFMLLSLWCYAGYVEKRKPRVAAEATGGGGSHEGRQKGLERGAKNAEKSLGQGRLWYGLSLLFFVLSFMSKAMVVTLPFLLLLLDFWPLGRIPSPHPDPLPSHPTGAEREQPASKSSIKQKNGMEPVLRLITEKIPFFALAVVFSGLTFWIQHQHSAVTSLAKLGIVPRLENVTLSYVYYLSHFFWPAKLSVFYQYPESFDVVQVLFAGLALAGISALCVLEISRRPYLAMGWCWYLGTMIPVIGLVQIGVDAMADRYTYIPLIGPVISLAWLASEWARGRLLRNMVSAAAIVIIGACIVLTRQELSYWQNSVTLFNRAIAVAPEYSYPHFPLALGLEEQKRLREAATQFQYSLAMEQPRIQAANRFNNIDFLSDLHLAGILGQFGLEWQTDEYLEAALKVDPGSTVVMNNLAWSLATSTDARVRNGARAVELAERACELTNYKQTLFIGTLAAAYAEAGRFDEAVATCRKAITSAQERGETDAAQRNQELLQLYMAHQAYHEGKNDVWTVTPNGE